MVSDFRDTTEDHESKTLPFFSSKKSALSEGGVSKRLHTSSFNRSMELTAGAVNRESNNCSSPMSSNPPLPLNNPFHPTESSSTLRGNTPKSSNKAPNSWKDSEVVPEMDSAASFSHDCRHFPDPQRQQREKVDLKADFSARKPLIGTLQLVGITFFAVAGGPYGLEESIAAAGVVPVICGLVIFPLIWAMPLALMTAEMATMIPESGGHIIWVDSAFGPFVSYLNSVLTFFCSSFDNALYPVLFIDYIKTLFSETNSCKSSRFHLSLIFKWSIKIAVVVSVLCINLAGVDIVGSASYYFTVAVIAPFFIFVIMGIPKFNFNFLSSPPPQKIHWGEYFAVLLWNYSGFDSAGMCAAEVANPADVYPKALSISVLLIAMSYILPTVIGMSLLPDASKWCDGTFVIVSNMIGGPMLKTWMAICGSVSAFGIFVTLLLTSSRSVYGMASVGQLPSIFCQLDKKNNCPRSALFLNAIITLLLSSFDFASLAEIDMMFYGLSTILKIFAFLYFRFYCSKRFRPFKIPLDKYSLAVLSIIPISICILMIVLCDLFTIVVGIICCSMAIIFYFTFGIASNRPITGEDEAMSLFLSHEAPHEKNQTKDFSQTFDDVSDITDTDATSIMHYDSSTFAINPNDGGISDVHIHANNVPIMHDNSNLMHKALNHDFNGDENDEFSDSIRNSLGYDSTSQNN